MSSHLFPVKLARILGELIDTKEFNERLAPEIDLHSPEDGKTRYMLFDPGTHKAVKAIAGNRYSRIRLAVPTNMRFTEIREVMLEFYSVEGELFYSKSALKLDDDYMSAALEAELLNLLLRHAGIFIPTM